MAGLTVKELIAVYLRHCDATGRYAPAVRRRIVKLFDDFLVTFGDRLVDDCRAYELRDWIEAKPGWLTSGTRRTKAAFIKAPFGWAFADGRISRHPFAGVSYAEGERAPDFSDDVLDLILANAHPRAALALRFLRLTGCRISELCAARWEDLDFERAEWIVRQHKTRKSTKKSKLITLIPEAVELLSPHRCESGPVFLNTRGRPWTPGSFWDHLNRQKSKHAPGCAASTHGIRHQFGSVAVANGASPKLVGAQMGHASVRTTEKYYVNLDGQADAIRQATRLSIAKQSES